MDKQDRDRCPGCGKVGSALGSSLLCTNVTCRVELYYKRAPIDKETDVDKRNCPNCGEQGQYCDQEDHGSGVWYCFNGECRVYKYLVHGDDGTGQDEQGMTDDEAMLQLIWLVKRLSIRITGIASKALGKDHTAVWEDVDKELDALRKHYRRE